MYDLGDPVVASGFSHVELKFPLKGTFYIRQAIVVEDPRVLASSRFCDGFNLQTGAIASCLGKLVSAETECGLFVAA